MIKQELTIKIPKSLPKAVGYRMVVVVPEISQKTAGGIYVPDNTKDAESYANCIAYVADMGPECYNKNNDSWCKIGDWILIGKYDGQRVRCEDSEVRIVNDDSILAVLPDPSTIRRAA